MNRTIITALLLCMTFVSRVARGDLHAEWDALLRERVKDGVVDYAGIRNNPGRLDAYLTTLAKTDPAAFSRADRLAYWINAYNAFTIRLILNHYPLKSIRDISRPWHQKVWIAGGKVYSLDQIEHAILRKTFTEPRIHFAIVCASIGCPDLQNRAYTGAEMEAQLDRAARKFMRSSKHVRTRITRGWRGKEKKNLQLSRIFTWFSGDFTNGGKQTVPEFVARYADEKTQQFILEAGPALDLDALPYDWNLNGK